MERVCNLNFCTGCSACFSCCPVQSITMQEDKRGFIKPKIDQTTCIDCGLCVKICPVNNKLKLEEPKKVYAGWSNEIKEQELSSSGGLATEISRQVLKHGGIVYGASFKDNCTVEHIRIEHANQLEEIRGSKYVQSNIGKTYKECKKDLLDKFQVLFIGTPCQIAGLKNYLRKPYSNLLTIDIICHGVPSQKMLKEFVYSKTKILSPIQVSFRSSGQFPYLFAIKSNNKILYKSILFSNDNIYNSYYDAFLRCISFRNSCYSCPYAKKERVGDLTLGDFWGLGDEIPFNENRKNKGVSLVLINSEKGLLFIKKYEDAFALFERTIQEAIKKNAQLRKPSIKNIEVKIFNGLYPFLSFNSTIKLINFYRKLSYYLKVIYFKSKALLNKIIK